MSLLNDALKAAEQRQGRPAPSPYTCQSAAAPARRRNPGRVLAGLAILLILGGGAYYLYLYSLTPPATPTADQAPLAPDSGETMSASNSTDQTTGAATPEPDETAQQPIEESAIVEASEPPSANDQNVADIVMQSSQQAGSEPVTAPSEASTPVPIAPEPETSAENAAAPEVAEPKPEPVQRGPQPPAQTASTARTEAPNRDEPETAQASEVPAESQPSADANIKQTRQTSAQRDRDASKAIRTGVSNGDVAAAEATLTGITDTQVAPQSRYAFARAVLARGDVDRALAWVPEDLAADYPDLRLIRARALLAGGDLDRAVATLGSSVPPAADNTEYRVTLATLLQQQGRSNEAANHWAELIALDDSQAPWWVGLAIALEGRGDVPAARRAYQQAAALPGLAPSLADYVRQRLQILGAG